MKRTISIIITLLLLLPLAACGVPEIDVQNGNVPDEEVNGVETENTDQSETEDVFEGFVDTSDDSFVYMRPSEEEMAAIEVQSGADFSTISMEALQGYWYCREDETYEVFIEVDGDTATIRELLDGHVLDVWYGTGIATISQPGENGWKNPGLDISLEDGSNIALIVLRRVGNGYFTTANSGVYYKVDEK